MAHSTPLLIRSLLDGLRARRSRVVGPLNRFAETGSNWASSAGAESRSSPAGLCRVTFFLEEHGGDGTKGAVGLGSGNSAE